MRWNTRTNTHTRTRTRFTQVRGPREEVKPLRPACDVLHCLERFTLRRGAEEPSGGDFGGISPLRSSPAAAFCLLFRGFVFLRRLLAKLLGGLFL